MLLGGVVVADEQERRVGRGAEEGRVDEVPHPCLGRRVDERLVLVDPVLALGAGDHQCDVDAFERTHHRVAVAVLRLHHLGAAAATVPCRGACDEPLLDVGGGQQPRDPTADVAGRPGDAERHGLSPAFAIEAASAARWPSRASSESSTSGPPRRPNSTRSSSSPMGAPGHQRAVGARPSQSCRQRQPSRMPGREPVGMPGGGLGCGRRPVHHLDLRRPPGSAACPSRRGT